VGANSGVYVFKRSGTSWAQEAKLLPSDGDSLDQFGGSVSISGDSAVVGAVFNDDNGRWSGSAYLFEGFTSPIGVERERARIPTEFSLSQNHPNPFNPETTIEFTLPVRSDVNLIVYNLRGEEVTRLLNGTMPAGNHKVTWNPSNFPSGIYFYRLQAGDFVQTKKMVLLK